MIKRAFVIFLAHFSARTHLALRNSDEPYSTAATANSNSRNNSPSLGPISSSSSRPSAGNLQVNKAVAKDIKRKRVFWGVQIFQDKKNKKTTLRKAEKEWFVLLFIFRCLFILGIICIKPRGIESFFQR